MGFIDGLIDGLTGGGLSSFFSMFDAALDSLGLSQHGRDQYFNRETQREFLSNEQNFQREMTGVSQDFTREMYFQQWKDMMNRYPVLAQRLSDQQFNLWRQQFNMQNDWNELMYQKYLSPQAVVSQNAAAGINPAGMNGVNNGVSANTMGASSAASPPHINPVPFGANGSPVGLPQGLSSKGHEISSIGSFIKDLAQAKKLNKESSRYDEITDAMVEKMYNEGLASEALAAYNGAKAVIERALGKEYKKSEIDVNLRLAMFYGQQEKTQKALEELHKAETWLSNSKNEEILERLPFIQDNLNAIRDFLESGAERNRAETGLSYAKSLTEVDLRNMYKQQGGLYEEVKGLRHVDRVEQYATMPDRILRSINEAEQSGLISQRMAEDLRTAQKNNDWYDVREGMNIMYNGLNQYYHGRFVNGYETKNSIDEKWNDYMIDHYGDTNEEYEETYMNNRGHKVRQRFSRKRAPKN